MPKIRIWTNYPPLVPDASDLRRRLPQYDIIVGKPDDPKLAEVDIAFGQPDPEQLIELPNVRWAHLNTAGYTKYDRDDLRKAFSTRGAILTTSSGVYSEPCAQHLLAMLLALARRLPHSLDNQRNARAWSMNEIRADSILLGDQHVLLVGYGSIARRLVELLAPLHMKIVGVRRKIKGDEPIPMVEIARLDEFLPQADHVMNMLPASPSTAGLFTASRFKKMKPSAIFYNIGRGDTVDQTALRDALQTKAIAAAYLDVMTPEPLPPTDPLWTTANCYVTLHTAGGHADEVERIIEHFIKNMEQFERGATMHDRVI